MFRQILCQQLKTLRFSNILGTLHRPVISQFINSRTCHTILGDDSVTHSIELLRAQVKNKSKISNIIIKSVSIGLERSKVDINQSLNILQYCVNGKFTDDPSPIVNQIWHQLKRQNSLQYQHFILMMQFCQEWKNFVGLQAIFDEMIEAKFTPNALAYCMLFDSYCRTGNIQKATDVWETMISKNFHNHESVYHGLIICHVLSGHIDTAKLIFMEKKEIDYKANFYVLESFLEHYTNENDIENIKKTFDSFAENEVPLNAYNVIKVMYQLSKNGKSEHIDNLMEYLKPLENKTFALRFILMKLIEDGDAPLIHTFLSKISENLSDDAGYVIQKMVQRQVHHTFLNDMIDKLKALDITMEKNFDIMKPALNGRSIELIWKMLHFMKNQSYQIDDSHFDQLLSLSSKKGSNYLLKTVKTMCSEFDVQPNVTTIRDIIMPGLTMRPNNIRKSLKQLRMADIRYGRCIQALLTVQLINNRLATAALIASDSGNIPFYFGNDLIVQPLLQSYGSTKDINAFVRLMKIVHKSIENHDSYKANNDSNDHHQAESSKSDLQRNFISKVLKTAAHDHCNGKKRIEPLLEELEMEGFSLTSEQAQQLRDSLGKVTAKIDARLKKLISGKLIAKPIQLHSQFSVDSSRIQKLIAERKKNGNGKENDMTLNRRLYNAYLMDGDFTNAISLSKKENLKLFPNDQARLIQAYVNSKQLENALDALKNAQTLDKSFKLMNPLLIARLVTLMIASKRSFDEIEAILIANKNEKPPIKTEISIFEGIFNRLLLGGNDELLNKLYEAAVKNGHIQATPSSTKFLVAVHLKKNNIEKAVEAYKRIDQHSNKLVLTLPLMTAIIKKKEFEILEDVYRMQKKIDKNLAAANLALAYIKCGYIRQAEFIFNDNQISNLSMVLVNFCTYFQKNNHVKGLQNLLKATENTLCDRYPIYETLLDIYCKNKDTVNAIRLWQECDEDVKIRRSKTLESKLMVLMKKNDIHLTLESLKSEADLALFFLNK